MRTENHRVARLRQRHSGVGNGDLVGIIRRAADQPLLGLEMRDALRVEPVDQPFHLGHHFGADAVAGEKQQFMGRHGSLPLDYWFRPCRAKAPPDDRLRTSSR